MTLTVLAIPESMTAGSCRHCSLPFVVETSEDVHWLRPAMAAPPVAGVAAETPSPPPGSSRVLARSRAVLQRWGVPVGAAAAALGLLVLALVGVRTLTTSPVTPERPVTILPPGALAGELAVEPAEVPASPEPDGTPSNVPAQAEPSPSPSPASPPEPSPSAPALPTEGRSPSPLAAAPPLGAPGHSQGAFNGAPILVPQARTRGPAASAPAATVEPDTPTPAPSPPTPILKETRATPTPSASTSGDFRDRYRREPFLLVTEFQQTSSSIVVWFYLSNPTQRNVNFAEPPRLIDAAGVQFQRGRNINWGLSGGTAEPGGEFGFWPSFIANGNTPAYIVLPTEEFGKIQVPVRPKSSNLGHFDSFPSDFRSHVEQRLKGFSGLRWWGGGSSSSSYPMPAATSNSRAPGY